MNKDIIARWIEAAKTLSLDVDLKVKCPVCQEGVLIIQDIDFPNDSLKFERHMTCSVCNARNSMVLHRIQ